VSAVVTSLGGLAARLVVERRVGRCLQHSTCLARASHLGDRHSLVNWSEPITAAVVKQFDWPRAVPATLDLSRGGPRTPFTVTPLGERAVEHHLSWRWAVRATLDVSREFLECP